VKENWQSHKKIREVSLKEIVNFKKMMETT
jgi:hypothetical protein